jgi:hypothetical protein
MEDRTGDPMPGPRNKRPWVPVLRDLNGTRGVNLTVVSAQWFATLSHWMGPSRKFIRHMTRENPCTFCVQHKCRPRWTAWVFALVHAEKRACLLPVTHTAITYCHSFGELHQLSQLAETHWCVYRTKESKNGPMGLRRIEEPYIPVPSRKFPDLCQTVVSLFDEEAGAPGE